MSTSTMSVFAVKVRAPESSFAYTAIATDSMSAFTTAANAQGDTHYGITVMLVKTPA